LRRCPLVRSGRTDELACRGNLMPYS
jgi:hypothetical protein